MSTALHAEIALITVPPPRSGHVVELLETIPGFTQAAAVYSGVDVVAVLEGTPEQIESAYALVRAKDTPISEIERFTVDEVVPGASSGSQEYVLRTSCTAFVRCAIRTDEVILDYAAPILARISGVRRAFVNKQCDEVMLEVVGRDKSSFDEAVMSSIQSEWSVVRSTRTLIAINGMRWSASSPSDADPTIFVSVASSDAHIATSLAKRLEGDLGISCWTYLDIPVGSTWTSEVDHSLKAALLHIMVVSEAALASGECQREFGAIRERSLPEDICCLVHPDLDFRDVALRYRQLQCIPMGDFLSYSHVLDWVVRRLHRVE
ncbi:MAG TPA: toll/interleukin-1 receptor domain-containing protein [Iamia sp.]